MCGNITVLVLYIALSLVLMLWGSFRVVVSKARWNNEMGMAEVVVQKGTFSKTTGIVRSGKLYYSIEEVL